MPAKKQAWEAESWEELQELVELKTVLQLLRSRARQRERDLRNNAIKSAAYKFIKNDPKLLKEALRQASK